MSAVLSVSHHGRLLAEVLVAVALFVAAVALRVWLSQDHPAYHAGDATAYYPAEAALQFRWAQELALQGRLLPVDYRAQWPEGLRFGVDITPVMEHTAAFVWRSLPWRPASFFDFSILFVAAVSSLTVVLSWVAVRWLGGGAAGAAVAAFLAAFHPWALERVIRNFGRENFALVWVVTPLVCLFVLWHRARRQVRAREVAALLAVSFLAQALAFASWHMARPLFELHSGVLLAAALAGVWTAHERRWLQAWFLSTVPLWLGLPVLRSRGYALTPNIVALTLLALGLGFARTWRRRLAVAGSVVVAWLAAHEFAVPAGDSHITELLAARLAHGFVKPADPARLSPEARLMWIEAFNAPSAADLVAYAGPLLIVGALVAWLARRRFAVRLRRDAGWSGLALVLCAWAAAWLTFDRLVVFFAFGIAVALGLLLSEALKSRWRAWAAAATLLLCCAVGAQTVGATPAQRLHQWLAQRLAARRTPLFQNRLADTRDLLRWLAANTSHDDVVVAWFGLSSQIYAYADRPVVVQSKFENPSVRPKAIALARALYGPPAELAGYCRRYGARYVVYEAPMVLQRGPESYRYVGGVQRIPTTSTVARMHFWPYDLDDFRLVYQNRGFRIFRYLDNEAATTGTRATTWGWYPLYDRQWCGIDDGDDFLDDGRIEQAVARALELEKQLVVAQALAVEEKTAPALRLARGLLNQEPRLWQAAVLMARLYAAAGNVEAAQKACTAAEVGYPQCPELPLHLTRSKGESDQ
jgi:hypothetical protein